MVTIQTEILSYNTQGYCDVINVTGDVQKFIVKHEYTHGQLLLFVNGATAGITTVEYEPGLVKDLYTFFERIIPQSEDYYHHQTWNDGNGFSHIRASLLKPSLNVPFSGSSLLLGTWQHVILVDFDNKPRKRELVIQCIGEK